MPGKKGDLDRPGRGVWARIGTRLARNGSLSRPRLEKFHEAQYVPPTGSARVLNFKK